MTAAVVAVIAYALLALVMLAGASAAAGRSFPNPAADMARERARQIEALDRVERRAARRALWRRLRPVVYGAGGGLVAVLLLWLLR